MKRLLLTIAFLLALFSTSAQIFLDPVKWDVSVEKENGDRYIILMKASIDDGWHLYSQKQFGEEFEGPIPTEFSYNSSEATYTLFGDTQEPDVIPLYDPVFEINVVYFGGDVLFTQAIDIIDPEGLKIKVDIFYSVCDDVKCLAPETKTFEVDLVSGKGGTTNAEVTSDDILKTNQLIIDVKGNITNTENKKSYLSIFLLGFLGGLLA
jgi:thiol:disulfide interchange protein DsbD